ncbi:DUF2059 domain-containing protein [Rhodanobacter ginsengisoli]|uniref:DUF2059 domain-containing protein n=1 Tax=Rhodanobacter ginsengisoli TaxID=418646 RepID=A0ABW0QNV0_9GAMM
MRKWIGIVAALVLATGVAGQAVAAQPSEKQVRQLFEVMHMGQMFNQMNSQMAGVMGQAVPCVPASYWQGFIDASGTEQLMGRMVPIYQRHFTARDVVGLLKFYKSPLGQKVIAEMPLTMAEGMKIGQQWGHERAEAMLKELQQKGTLDASGRCPASPGATTPTPVPKTGH